MLSRREWLSLTLATGAAAAIDRAWLSAQQPLIMRGVPASNERLPIVGLGSSATFSQVARGSDVTAVTDVMKALVSGGGTVFDTAPGYGASEEVAGRVAAGLSYTDKIFWATKVNVAGGFGGGGGRSKSRGLPDRRSIRRSRA
jgi:aryl-alcohol dehydrogenase-like predicted oxidoreductase